MPPKWHSSAHTDWSSVAAAVQGPSVSTLNVKTYNAEGFLVQIIIFILANGNRLTSCCNVDRTLRSLGFTWSLGITAFNLFKELQRVIIIYIILKSRQTSFVCLLGFYLVTVEVVLFYMYMCGFTWVHVYICAWTWRGHKRDPELQKLESQTLWTRMWVGAGNCMWLC